MTTVGSLRASPLSSLLSTTGNSSCLHKSTKSQQNKIQNIPEAWDISLRALSWGPDSMNSSFAGRQDGLWSVMGQDYIGLRGRRGRWCHPWSPFLGLGISFGGKWGWRKYAHPIPPSWDCPLPRAAPPSWSPTWKQELSLGHL